MRSVVVASSGWRKRPGCIPQGGPYTQDREEIISPTRPKGNPKEDEDMGGENNPRAYLSVCVTNAPAAALAYLVVSVVLGVLTVPIRPTRMVIVIGGPRRVSGRASPVIRAPPLSFTCHEFLGRPRQIRKFALRADGTSIPPGTIGCDKFGARWLTALV